MNGTAHKPVLVIMTGGTIDSIADYDAHKPVVVVRHSNVPAAMRAYLPQLVQHCAFMQWHMQGSEDFDREQLAELAEFIRLRAEQMVVITHGTGQMADNARTLQEMLDGSGKRVVMTGAMVPLSHGAASDGAANLRAAIAPLLARHVPAGVWVAMPDKAGKAQMLTADRHLAKHWHGNPPYFTGTALALPEPGRRGGWNKGG